MKRLSIFFVILLFSAAVLSAQKQTPPEGGTPKDFSLPKKETFTLKNGIVAVMVPFGNIPKVTIAIVVRSGNSNEKPNQVWLADFTGELMKEGTTSRSAESVAEDASSMGGSVNINVGPDQTTIGGDVLSEFGPSMVALLADVTRHPLMPETEVERIRNNFLRNVTVAKSSPQQLTSEQFAKMLYGDHAYGRVFPTEEMLKSYTIKDAKNFYENNFGARRTQIYVSGKFDAQKIEAAIRTAFEGWKKGPEPFINVPTVKVKKGFLLVERPGAPQSTIYLGLPVINPTSKEYIKLLVTNTLLGGYFSSRVTSNIREQKGYTYSPRSVIASHYHDSYYVQTADVGTDVTGAALKEILFEINRLQKEPPTADELKSVQNYMAGTFVLANSSRSGIISQLAFTRLQGIGDDYLTNYVKNVYTVTPADVQQMAKSQLRDDRMTLVITGDKEKVDKQIDEYAKSMKVEKK